MSNHVQKCAVFLLCLLGPATAQGGPRIKDLDKYLDSAQRKEFRRTEDSGLLLPTQGLPAVVPRGGTFKVYLAPSLAETCKAGASAWLLGRLPDYECDKKDKKDKKDVVCIPHQYKAEVRSSSKHKHKHKGKGKDKTFPVVELAIPLKVPVDSYDLRIYCAGKQVGERRLSVRVLAATPDKLRVVVLSDPQLGDPLIGATQCKGTFTKNEEPYTRSDAEKSLVATFRHIDALAPDLVLLPGDLSFGNDYRSEVPANMDTFADAGFATHFVPGNHDLYATHEPECALNATPPGSLVLQMLGKGRGEPLEAVAEAVMIAVCIKDIFRNANKAAAGKCKKHWPELFRLEFEEKRDDDDSLFGKLKAAGRKAKTAFQKLKDFDATKFKEAVLQFLAWLSCIRQEGASAAYADLKQTVDGRDFWEGWIGPTDYALDVGSYRFVGLNSMTGDPRRRGTLVLRMLNAAHRKKLSMEALGLKEDSLVSKLLKAEVPAVSNYGGMLQDDQLTWVDDQVSGASMEKRPLVVFMHHDPRGYRKDGRSQYVQEQKFPDGCIEIPEVHGPLEEWGIAKRVEGTKESRKNSGKELIEKLKSREASVILGHAHLQETSMNKEDGITFHRAPSVSSTCRNKKISGCDCRGFRLLEGRGGALVSSSLENGHDMVKTSWLTVTGGGSSRELFNSGENSITARARLTLEPNREGYIFSPGKLREVGFNKDNEPCVFYVEVTVGKKQEVALAPKPLKKGDAVEQANPTLLTANKEPPPERIEVGDSVDLELSEQGIMQLWSLDGAEVHRGPKFSWTPNREGTFKLVVRVMDGAGRVTPVPHSFQVKNYPWMLLYLAAGLVLLLLSGGGIFWFRRRARVRAGGEEA